MSPYERMLSLCDQQVLNVFSRYLVAPGEMLCFHGKWLEDHGESLRHLTAIKLIAKERFAGAYSLTHSGFAAINNANEIATSDSAQVQ